MHELRRRIRAVLDFALVHLFIGVLLGACLAVMAIGRVVAWAYRVLVP